MLWLWFLAWEMPLRLAETGLVETKAPELCGWLCLQGVLQGALRQLAVGVIRGCVCPRAFALSLGFASQTSPLFSAALPSA